MQGISLLFLWSKENSGKKLCDSKRLLNFKCKDIKINRTKKND